MHHWYKLIVPFLRRWRGSSAYYMISLGLILTASLSRFVQQTYTHLSTHDVYLHTCSAVLLLTIPSTTFFLCLSPSSGQQVWNLCSGLSVPPKTGLLHSFNLPLQARPETPHWQSPASHQHQRCSQLHPAGGRQRRSAVSSHAVWSSVNQFLHLSKSMFVSLQPFSPTRRPTSVT